MHLCHRGRKFDAYALGIIKLMRSKKPDWEVEVELKKPELH